MRYFYRTCSAVFFNWKMRGDLEGGEDMDKKDIFVREKYSDARSKILEFLDNMDYSQDGEETRTRLEIIDSILPIVVDRKNKEYRMMGNITCAAGAVSSGRMITKEELFRQF